FNGELDAFRDEVDQRFHEQDRRIERLAAMSGAYAGMAMNTAGLAGAKRVGVGVGGQNGESALATGYQRAIGHRASISIGAAFGGGESGVMGGAGFSWQVVRLRSGRRQATVPAATRRSPDAQARPGRRSAVIPGCLAGTP